MYDFLCKQYLYEVNTVFTKNNLSFISLDSALNKKLHRRFPSDNILAKILTINNL